MGGYFILLGPAGRLLRWLQRLGIARVTVFSTVITFLVVGHSLCSLIAYDALNRITLDMNAKGGIDPHKAQKIVGLVTFGSPLGKVAFFFREHTHADEHVRRQILAHLHGFKSYALPEDQNPISIDDPIKRHLDQTRWLNFCHLQDLVSGRLDACEVDENILCKADVQGSAKAHTVYWTYDEMYKVIGEMRPSVNGAAKGLVHPGAYLDGAV